jgi:hypothetical protein
VVLSGKLQFLPARDLSFLHKLVGAWDTVPALLGAQIHGAKLGGEKREKEESACARSSRRNNGRERGIVRRNERDK